jgi:hypothetical protein
MMSGRAGSKGGSRGFSELELTAIGELLPELRQMAVGQRVLYQSILFGLGLGLGAHLVGYWLRATAAGTEPLALVADLLYALGYSLWTGVVVVGLVQVFPELKRRQIKEALAAHRDWDLRTQRSKEAASGAALGRGQAEMLGAIVGRWRATGRVIGDEGDSVVGTDNYELLPGGHFLIHHVDVRVGDRPVRAIEIIGEPDPDTAAGGNSFLARSYDDSAVTVMRVRVDDSGAWHFSGGPEIAPAARPDGVAPASGAVRSTLRVAPDRQSMSAAWERTEDGSNWVPWMEISFTRLG